jgi:hypothetical protein
MVGLFGRPDPNAKETPKPAPKKPAPKKEVKKKEAK